MKASFIHRLDGLEPDNLLAFLALLGFLRALEAARPELIARVDWSIDSPPFRPRLTLKQPATRDELAESATLGVAQLIEVHDFAGRTGLNHAPSECRASLAEAQIAATMNDRRRADLLSALMHDAAVKGGKDEVIDPTPLCLLFGQGHQHFLPRLAEVPRLVPAVRRNASKAGQTQEQEKRAAAARVLGEALFEPWRREDATPSFRWDPAEDVRYATLGGDPTDAAFKAGTQHGANQLATVGLPLLQLGARSSGGRVRATVTAGRRDRDGFALAWPIWREPARLSGIVAMLNHPQLHVAGKLAHLGVVNVMVTRRISVGKFMNFTRARPL